MIEAKETLIGGITSKQTLSGSTNVTMLEIKPELEDITITPTKEQQTFAHENSDGYDNVTVKPIPEEYIIPDGTLDVDANGDVDVTMFSVARVGVYTPPNLQDKSITITENGTQNITADSGYDGLGNVEVSVRVEGGETPVEPNYIQDGLVAWWDGADEVDENCHWLSRVGTDYLSQGYFSVPLNVIYNNFSLLHCKEAKCYKNNSTYTLVTQNDYFKKGYTFEIVGKTLSDYGGTLMAFDRSSSPMINLTEIDGTFRVVNSNSFTMEKTYRGYNKKRNTFVINLEEVPSSRGSSGNHKIRYSINGRDWKSTNTYSLASQTNKANDCVFMSYYYNSSGHLCEINSIRIYNRALTYEELLHNYEEDKKRFDMYEDVN